MADNVTTTELETALQELATGMGLSVVEYVQGLGYSTTTELATAITGVQGQINAITELDANNGAESLAEKIAAINAVLTDGGQIANIISLINANSAAIASEEARAIAAETALQTQTTANGNKATSNETAISDLAAVVAANKNVADTDGDSLLDGVNANALAIGILNGDDAVVGSVASSVKGEEDRAKAVEAANAQQATANETAITGLQGQIDSLTGAGGNGGNTTLAGLNVRVTNVENNLNDTTDVNGDLVKGNNSKIADLEAQAASASVAGPAAIAQALVDAKAYSDARDLKAASMDVCVIGNKFRQALGLADATCGNVPPANGGNGDGAVL